MNLKKIEGLLSYLGVKINTVIPVASGKLVSFDFTLDGDVINVFTEARQQYVCTDCVTVEPGQNIVLVIEEKINNYF